ncbi:MAG: glycosyltransferase [Moraxellaceae bacterium]|nr:glycosyltransferase [Moraxellaceae bacterium]
MSEMSERLIAVIGMHRSGTSAVTRGLQVLGVELGDNLLQPAEDNPKGFWEDLDFFAINVEILDFLNKEWHFLTPIQPQDIELLRRNGYLLRAVELLREKTNGIPVFGFKDPRLVKLLPFWKEVFAHCGINVHYVIPLRHPISVCKSLEKRNGFDFEKSYFLWLEHVVNGFVGTIGEKCSLVDYDRFIDSTKEEIKRLGLELNLSVDTVKLNQFLSDFIDEDLRHTIYKLEDLDLDQHVPPLVKEVYSVLVDVLDGKLSMGDASFQNLVLAWQDEILRMKSLLMLADKLSRHLVNSENHRAQQEKTIQSLQAEKALAVEKVHMTEQALTAQIREKEQSVQALAAQVREKDAKLNEIVNSKVWKFGLFFRRVRVILAPPNSRRARAMRALFMFIFFPLRKINQHRKIGKDTILIKASGMFDEHWYLTQNPDIAHAGIDPARHYLLFGGFEGRDPFPNFSSKWYLESYPDVKAAGVNPLVHYLKSGSKEGRAAQQDQAEYIYPNAGARSQTMDVFNILHKTALAWKEGGVRLLWQKVRRKVRRVSPELGATLTALPIETPSLENLHYQPLISVLIPTYNTPVQYLFAAVNSVRNQFYPHWEICICDDASSDKATRSALCAIEKSDARIKVCFLAENGGISTATNKAAEIAEGEFIAFLDHDDELTPNALYEMALALNEDDGVDLLYSDQDKIDANGIDHEPFYKPDWSPEYLRSVMYVGHLLVVKRELFQRVNGMQHQFDGVQDFEFMLRISETNPRIIHIPKILYHWRKIPGSVAMGLDEKGDKIEILQARAVNEHFSRLGLRAVAVNHPRHRHRLLVQPNARESYPMVSIIILTKDAPVHIRRCLRSIFEKTTYPNYEVLVVDNETTHPDALKVFNEYPAKVIPFREKFNYSKANNSGVRNSGGEFIILLNNDTEVITPDWIEQLLFYCEMPGIGAVGPLLVYPDRTVQHAGIVLGSRGTADHVMRHFQHDSDGYAGSLSCPREVSAVTGACLMIKRGDYLGEDGLSEYYGTHYQDVDLCLRLLAKDKRNLYVPHAMLIHYEGSTRGKFYDHLDRALLLDTWGEWIEQGDKFYNPNFSLRRLNYTLGNREKDA